MVAGFLKGWLQTSDYALAFKRGIAAGSASAFSRGMADAEAVKKLYAKVHIEVMREPVMEAEKTGRGSQFFFVLWTRLLTGRWSEKRHDRES